MRTQSGVNSLMMRCVFSSTMGYLCSLISDTTFHSEYASFLHQPMGCRETVTSTRHGLHSGPNNAFAWHSAAMDGVLTRVQTVLFSLCDRTVHCAFIHSRYSCAPRSAKATSLKTFVCGDKTRNRAISCCSVPQNEAWFIIAEIRELSLNL